MPPNLFIMNFREEVEQELNELDAQAEALGAPWIRERIQTALNDITAHPAGKESAYRLIPKLRTELRKLGDRHSEKRLRRTGKPAAETEINDDVA